MGRVLIPGSGVAVASCAVSMASDMGIRVRSGL